MSEQSQLCDNCKKMIPTSKITTHFGYCRRNVKKCDTCNQMYDINCVEDHEQEFHKKEKCQHCKQQFVKDKFSKHLDTCHKKPKFCEYCEQNVPTQEYSVHLKICQSRTKVCERCHKSIVNLNFLLHISSCNGIEKDIIQPPKSYNHHIQQQRDKITNEIKEIPRTQQIYKNSNKQIRNQLKYQPKQDINEQRNRQIIRESEKEKEKERQKIKQKEKQRQRQRQRQKQRQRQRQRQRQMQQYQRERQKNLLELKQRQRRQRQRQIKKQYKPSEKDYLNYNKQQLPQKDYVQTKQSSLNLRHNVPQLNKQIRQKNTNNQIPKSNKDYRHVQYDYKNHSKNVNVVSYDKNIKIDQPKSSNEIQINQNRNPQPVRQQRKKIFNEKEITDNRYQPKPLIKHQNNHNFNTNQQQDLELQRVIMESMGKMPKNNIPQEFIGMDMNQSFYRDLEHQGAYQQVRKRYK